jgi:hypothetical protein
VWPVLVLSAVLALSGCTTVRQTGTERSSIEQRLLVRALERAVRRMDTEVFRGRRIDVRLYGLTTDQTFAQEFVASRLALRGVHVVRAGEPSDTVVRMFATALAVDNDSTLFGLPAMQAPVLAVPIPEIAIFKAERSRGHAEIELYLYDDDGYFIGALPDAFGQSTYRRFTILIVISFGTGDLKKPGESPD